VPWWRSMARNARWNFSPTIWTGALERREGISVRIHGGHIRTQASSHRSRIPTVVMLAPSRHRAVGSDGSIRFHIWKLGSSSSIPDFPRGGACVLSYPQSRTTIARSVCVVFRPAVTQARRPDRQRIRVFLSRW
jgi:hypothetical protein